MADLLSIDDRTVIPLRLAGTSLALRVPEGATARRLRFELRACVEPRVAEGAREVAVDVARLERPTSTQALAAVLRAAAGALFPEVLFFHAAAIGSPHGVSLFIAPSGAGKTTLAVLAARVGLGVFADDVACVRVADRVVLPSLVRLRHREAMLRLVAPPRKMPPVVTPSPLARVVLLGAGRKSTSAFVGTEALVSEIAPQRRWEAACVVARVLEGIEVRRMPPIDLDDRAGVRRARVRLRGLLVELGASPARVARVLG